MKLHNHNVEKGNCCRSIVKPNSNELFWPITEDEDNRINQLKLDMVTCRLDDAMCGKTCPRESHVNFGCGFTSDWLIKQLEH